MIIFFLRIITRLFHEIEDAYNTICSESLIEKSTSSYSYNSKSSNVDQSDSSEKSPFYDSEYHCLSESKENDKSEDACGDTNNNDESFSKKAFSIMKQIAYFLYENSNICNPILFRENYTKPAIDKELLSHSCYQNRDDIVQYSFKVYSEAKHYLYILISLSTIGLIFWKITFKML